METAWLLKRQELLDELDALIAKSPIDDSEAATIAARIKEIKKDLQ